MKGHAIIGFNHGLLGLAENPARGPGFFRQNTSGYALVTIIATLRWASCGPGTGLQAHPLKSQYRFGKKNVCWQITQKLQKTSVPNLTYLFWTLYIASRTNNKLKQLYFNGAMSMFFQQSLHLPKNKQPKWRLLWSRDRWDHVSWFPLPSLGPSPMENPMLNG